MRELLGADYWFFFGLIVAIAAAIGGLSTCVAVEKLESIHNARSDNARLVMTACLEKHSVAECKELTK